MTTLQAVANPEVRIGGVILNRVGSERHDQVLRAHAYALHVEDFQPPNGQKVQSQPFLDNNNFGNSPVSRNSATVAAQPNPR